MFEVVILNTVTNDKVTLVSDRETFAEAEAQAYTWPILKNNDYHLIVEIKREY